MSIFGKLQAAGVSSDGSAIQLLGLGGRMGAKLLGAGTSTNPAAISKNGVNFLQFYFKHEGVSGDNRGLYLRTYFAGGAGGDCARVFASVQEDCGTVHGQHTSLNFTAGKQVSGQGIAHRNTLHIPDDALSTGTLAAVQAEAYMDGTSADPGSAAHGLFRAIVDGGDATAQGKFLNFLLATLPTGAHDSGKMYITTNDATFTEGLRCVINGAVRYIGVFTSPVAP